LVPIVAYIVTVLAGYLVGSIPTGFLVAKARGIDIRTVGSGNIGATNVFRQIGTVAGVFVLLMDALKGWVAFELLAKLAAVWLYPGASAQAQEALRICAGLSVIVGHNYTCWLHFKGGKGVATTAGVLLAWVPWSLLIIFCVWVVVFALTRYVSLASICAAASLPFAAWFTGEGLATVIITAAMGALAIYKHKANIKRLISGTETRLATKKASPQPEAPKQTP